jgi:hypothetical protein
MGAGETPHQSARIRTLQRRLRLIGVVLLAAGLPAAGWVYHRTPSDDGVAELFQAGTLLSGNAKRAENEMKDLGGKANVIAGDFSDWFEGLWHGRRLAGTLTVLSLSGAGACLFLAHLLNYPPLPDREDSDGRGPGPKAKRPGPEP